MSIPENIVTFGHKWGVCKSTRKS